MKLNDLRIGVRLGGGFAVILALLALMMAIGVWRLSSVAGATRQMMEVPLAKERLAEEWFRNIAVGVRRTTAIAKSADPSLETLLAPDAKASTERGTQIMKELEALPGSPEETALMAAVGDARKGYLGARDAVMKAKRDGKPDEANKIFDAEFSACRLPTCSACRPTSTSSASASTTLRRPSTRKPIAHAGA